MAYGTIIQQGTFTAVAGPTILNIVTDVDWLKVYDPVNYGVGAAVGFEYFWQRGMAVGTGVYLYHAAASTVVNSGLLAAPLGFTLLDTSTITPSAQVVIAASAGSNTTTPTYLTANTLGTATGAIFRIISTAQTNLNGLDFSGTVVNNTSIQLTNTLQQAPGVLVDAGGAAPVYRMIAQNITIYNRYYPRKRVIANITQAAPGVNVVTTLVDHSYTTGQYVRMEIPAICGMVELNGRLATVTVINASTFSIDIDTTNMTAFVFPLPAAVPFTPAEVIPVGENSTIITGVNVLADAFVDNNFRGMLLGYDTTAAGLAPAGINGHTMYWIAGKSENV